MYYEDHGPPHFHAYSSDCEASINIASLEITAGELPPRAVALVRRWAAQYRGQLLDNWKLAARHQPLRKIPPLE
jgi:hypothetical protein